ncbi:MAG: hypothetical protein GY774_35785 [Planctomycetes bacterium]|nr:hypothetical protein [Planctomycetota bacterium]
MPNLIPLIGPAIGLLGGLLGSGSKSQDRGSETMQQAKRPLPFKEMEPFEQRITNEFIGRLFGGSGMPNVGQRQAQVPTNNLSGFSPLGESGQLNRFGQPTERVNGLAWAEEVQNEEVRGIKDVNFERLIRANPVRAKQVAAAFGDNVGAISKYNSAVRRVENLLGSSTAGEIGHGDRSQPFSMEPGGFRPSSFEGLLSSLAAIANYRNQVL